MSHRLVLFGTSDFGIPSFTALHESPDFTIVAVVTQPARPVGRKQELRATPVATWANERQLPVLTPTTLKREDIQQQLASYGADAFVVASYGLILPAQVLDIPPHGCYNIHASLLPKYRGASPIAAAIANGDTTTGITFMLMDPGCDTGPILKSFDLAIDPKSSRPELEQRLSAVARQHVVAVLRDTIAGELSPIAQDNSQATLAPKLTRESGHADWQDAEQLERRIRAYTPWPGVWTTLHGREWKILSADVEATTVETPLGSIIEHHSAWAIVCQRGLLIPRQVHVSGKQPQDAASIPGSYPNFIGDQFDAPDRDFSATQNPK